MNERLNKPRIFLSHSKKDADLIKRLYDDLRQCQIDPWIDEMDIRPGKPWLDAIFEEGIPMPQGVLPVPVEQPLQLSAPRNSAKLQLQF